MLFRSLLDGVGKIMAAKEEIKDSEKYFFRYVKTNWDFANIEAFEYADTGIGPVGRSFDLFGDGSVLLVNTPGHTHGLFTAVIIGDEKFIALAGDTIYTKKSIDEQLIPGFTVNKTLARKSLAWLTALQNRGNCVGVIANHDPEVNEQVIIL